jgi:hypothetical protein
MANIIPDDRWVVEDDGLFCQEVGPWAETKHNLVSYYGRLFSTGMKDKWDRRIYIELYAGAGYLSRGVLAEHGNASLYRSAILQNEGGEVAGEKPTLISAGTIFSS